MSIRDSLVISPADRARPRKVLVALVGATSFATGIALTCLPAGADPAAAAPAHAAEGEPAVSITIGNFAFSPATLTVPAGTELIWANEDDAPHTVEGVDDDSPISSPPLDTGDRYSVVIQRPGTYRYFCTLHPFMVGTVIVSPPALRGVPGEGGLAERPRADTGGNDALGERVTGAQF